MVVAHFPDLILIPISPHGIQLRLTVSKQRVTACQCSTFNISRSNFATIESHSTNWKLQDIQKTSSVLRSQSQFRSRRWNSIPSGWWPLPQAWFETDICPADQSKLPTSSWRIHEKFCIKDSHFHNWHQTCSLVISREGLILTLIHP